MPLQLHAVGLPAAKKDPAARAWSAIAACASRVIRRARVVHVAASGCPNSVSLLGSVPSTPSASARGPGAGCAGLTWLPA